MIIRGTRKFFPVHVVRLSVCLSRNLTGQDAPHFAIVDLSRPGGPENGSGSTVPNQYAAEYFDRTGPTREDRNHAGPSR